MARDARHWGALRTNADNRPVSAFVRFRPRPISPEIKLIIPLAYRKRSH
jgi:hypothetical protein